MREVRQKAFVDELGLEDCKSSVENATIEVCLNLLTLHEQ